MSLFIKLVGIYPVYSFVELNTKERRMITTINPASLHQPIVVLTFDGTGSPYRNPLTVDLPNQDNPPHAPLNVWSHQKQAKRVAQPNAPCRT